MSHGVLRNIGTAACCRAAGEQSDISTVHNAAIAWEQGRFVWVGAEKDLPERYSGLPQYSADGNLVIPGLIDCHTHLAFGGWRADEFARKIRGESYENIAKSGGGIISTVKKTRECSEDALAERAANFLNEIAKLGVTTVECKTGYGLDLANELKTLHVYKKLQSRSKLRILPTLLSAHAIPPEYLTARQEYIELIEHEILPTVVQQQLARFFDVFVEDIAFSHNETRQLCSAAKAYGLGIRLHVDQLTSNGGAELAAELGALSADHLENISPNGIASLKRSATVAVTLPIASLYTRLPPLNARELLNEGVAVAVATDFNPGSAPSYHLPFAMLLACTLNRMLPAEALKGATIVAAQALGLAKETGSLEVGKCADLAIIDAIDVDTWIYHFRANACLGSFVSGEQLYVR